MSFIRKSKPRKAPAVCGLGLLLDRQANQGLRLGIGRRYTYIALSKSLGPTSVSYAASWGTSCRVSGEVQRGHRVNSIPVPAFLLGLRMLTALLLPADTTCALEMHTLDLEMRGCRSPT